jgi:cytochrome c
MKFRNRLVGPLMVAVGLGWAIIACGSFAPPKGLPALSPLTSLVAEVTSLVSTAQPLIATLAPTLEAAATELAPTLEAAATGLVPTLEAAATELAPTLEAAATQVASGGTPQPSQAVPANLGTPDQAKAMLAKAVAHYTAAGRQQALTDFTRRVAPFFDRDLYVACIDANLKQSANGGFPDLVGSTVQPLSRAAWDAATTTIGTVKYNWVDPATGQTLPKTFFYEKIGSDVCGVGAYQP